MGCKNSKDNKKDVSQPQNAKPLQNGVTTTKTTSAKESPPQQNGKSTPFERFEFSNEILQNPNFKAATGVEPSKEAYEKLKQDYLEVKKSGVRDLKLFELALAVGTIGLFLSDNSEDESIAKDIIDSIMKPNVELGKELFGANSPQVAEVYDCMAIQSEPIQSICKIQIDGLRESIKIKESYRHGPELGRSYSFLASNLAVLEERKEMSSVAQKAVPLLIDVIEEGYLPEFAIAATFVDEHKNLDTKFVDSLKKQLPLLFKDKKKLRHNEYDNDRSFVQIIMSKIKRVVEEAIDKIEHEGIIFKPEEQQ